MSVDIRNYTRVIVHKNGCYLQGREMISNRIVWSNSLYNAWWTRDIEKARDVALRTGGVMMLFNPVVRQVKYM